MDDQSLIATWRYRRLLNVTRLPKILTDVESIGMSRCKSEFVMPRASMTISQSYQGGHSETSYADLITGQTSHERVPNGISFPHPGESHPGCLYTPSLFNGNVPTLIPSISAIPVAAPHREYQSLSNPSAILEDLSRRPVILLAFKPSSPKTTSKPRSLEEPPLGLEKNRTNISIVLSVRISRSRPLVCRPSILQPDH